MKRILVLGYFGYRTNQLDGQTVKTRDVYRLVKEQSGVVVDFFDTQDFKSSKLSIFYMFWKIIKSKTLIYLPAHNNLKFIFPIIFCITVLFRVKIHYFVVGGWLREFISTLPIHRYMLSRIAGIHVETLRLKDELQAYYKFDNVDIFPNFRFFHYDKSKEDSSKLRIAVLDNKSSLIDFGWIIHLADYILLNKLDREYSISIYGNSSNEIRCWLHQNIHRIPFLTYYDVNSSRSISEFLSQSDILVLPTINNVENLQTSVNYGFMSGLPVISPELNQVCNYIDEGQTGFVIPLEKGFDLLINRICILKQKRNILYKLQANVLSKKASLFSTLIDKRQQFNIAFISRVEESKGLDTLKEIASLLESLDMGGIFHINLFGSKTDSYFDSHLKSSKIIHYNGVLQPKDVIPTLRKSDLLIFPTHYDGEGCPGILVEALSAGLPIVASDWKYNNEFVEDGINGFLCETFNSQAYVDAILAIYNNHQLASFMSKQSYRKSFEFSVDHAGDLLKNILATI